MSSIRSMLNCSNLHKGNDMIEVREEIADKQALQVVMDYLEARGTKYASIYNGNDCIWVASGFNALNEYFIFRNGKLVDIQAD